MTATTETATTSVKRPIGAREVQALADIFDTHRDVPAPGYLAIGRHSDGLGGNVYASWGAESREDLAAWAAVLGVEVNVYDGRAYAVHATVTVDGLDVQLTMQWIDKGEDR